MLKVLVKGIFGGGRETVGSMAIGMQRRDGFFFSHSIILAVCTRLVEMMLEFLKVCTEDQIIDCQGF